MADVLGCENCQLVLSCAKAYNDEVEEKGVEVCKEYQPEGDLNKIMSNMRSKLLQLGVNEKAVERYLAGGGELTEGA